MEDWLASVIKTAVVIINAIAAVFLFIGTIQVFVGALRTMFLSSAGNHQRREVWLEFSRWLVAGLSVQLAADILETSIAPTWEEIGKLGAIAAIRTFLNYFLELDMSEIRRRDKRGQEPSMRPDANAG